MDIVEYCERVGPGKFVKSFILASLMLTFSVFTLIVWLNFSLFSSLSWTSVLFMIVMALPIVLISILYLFFGSLRITITSKELSVAFGPFNRKHFLLSDIDSCEQTVTNFRKYFGAGIRYGVDGSMAYSTSFGRAVKINRSGEKAFVFSTNYPDKICHIISVKIAKNVNIQNMR